MQDSLKAIEAGSNINSGRTMQNILYHYSSQQIHTGSPRVLMHLVEGLDRYAFTPYFLASSREGLCHELEKKGTIAVWGKTGQITKKTLPRNIFNILKIIGLLRKHEISLVHINELGWNSELALAAWLLRLPVIFHIHNKEKLSLKNLNCRIGSKFLFVSNALARQCSANALLGNKVEILYNPVKVDSFVNGTSIRHEFGVPENAFIVGTVAQIRRGKGIDTIIETAGKVISKLPNTWFLILGPEAKDELEFAEQLRQRVSELNLGHRVKFCGPREDVANFLASIDVFFLPTRAEAFGMVIAEAMAARVPVVTSNVGGIPEIIPDGTYGVTADIEEKEFHRMIVKLLTETEHGKSIAEKGFERVKTLFSDEVFNLKIRQLYNLLTP